MGLIGVSLEIALHNQPVEPRVESLSEGRVRIHIDVNCTLEELLDGLLLLDEGQVLRLRRLWEDKSIERNFVDEGDYVLITEAE